MRHAYELYINQSSSTQFNGQVEYANATLVHKATEQLRSTLDFEYDMTIVDNVLYVEDNIKPGFGRGPLRATNFLQAVLDSNPNKAEFEAEGTDYKSYKINLADGKWVLLSHTRGYQEVI